MSCVCMVGFDKQESGSDNILFSNVLCKIEPTLKEKKTHYLCLVWSNDYLSRPNNRIAVSIPEILYCFPSRFTSITITFHEVIFHTLLIISFRVNLDRKMV